MGKPLPAPLDTVHNDVSRFIVQMLSETYRKNKPQFAIDDELEKAKKAAEEVEANAESGGKNTALDFKTTKQEPAQQSQPTFADFYLALSPMIRREYELKREVIHRDFIDHLHAEFAKVLTPPKKLFSKNSVNSDTLELVDNETLMFRLALDNFSSKVNEHYKVGIALVCLRVEKVLGFEIDMFLSPLAPYAIGEAVEQSLSALDLDVNDKKPLLMAMLKGLIVQYGQLLKLVNDLLIKKGVLPRLTEADAKARIEKYLRKVKAQENGVVEPEPEKNVAKGAGNFSRDFFQQVELPKGSQHQVAFNPNGVLIPQEHLLQNIGSMKSVLVNTDQQSGYLMPAEQQGTFSELLAENTDLGEFALSAENSKTIGIVSMLFDTLKKEEGISAPIKALLLQLTVPLLKAAVQDDEFFSDKSNPAQILFNSIAEVSSTWTAESSANNDFLYKKMSDIVSAVTDNYDEDYSVFESAVDDLESFVSTENQKSQRIEERIIASETAKARIQSARKKSQDHIYTVFGDYILDEELKQFLDSTWEHALFFIANSVIECEESDLWQQALKVESKLVHILDGERFEGTIDELFNEISAVVLSSGKSDAHALAELELIRKELQLIINDSNQTSEGDSKPATALIKKLPEKEVEFVDAQQEQANEAELASIREVLEKINLGSWFEDREASPAVKIKLAAHIKFTDTFVFVNRKGVKAASYDGPTLAGLMQDKLLVLVDNTMLYDRSMERIIGELRT